MADNPTTVVSMMTTPDDQPEQSCQARFIRVNPAWVIFTIASLVSLPASIAGLVLAFRSKRPYDVETFLIVGGALDFGSLFYAVKILICAIEYCERKTCDLKAELVCWVSFFLVLKTVLVLWGSITVFGKYASWNVNDPNSAVFVPAMMIVCVHWTLWPIYLTSLILISSKGCGYVINRT